MAKYARLRERLDGHQDLTPASFVIPEPASWDALARVHGRDYLAALKTGDLPRDIERRIGFPYSPQMVERSRRSVGGTLAAAAAARRGGVAVNLAGGTHHAFADTGAGYCVLNDVVVAARQQQADAALGQVLVVDLDVHQGDGTAALCAGDSAIVTFSMHGERNYPTRKQVSDLDVPLPDGCGDTDYLAALQQHLPALLATHQPELVFFLAGADPFEGDRLGRLALSKAGLQARDRLVFEVLEEAGVPVVVVMAGGYANDVEDIVDIHAATVLAAHASWRRRNAGHLDRFGAAASVPR
ncbi:MAG: histone deacetylase [Pseudomonadota bacterium]